MADDFDDLVEGILDALDTDDPALRRKLRESLERGFDLAMDQPGTDVQIELDLGGDDPDMVELDGGRSSERRSSEPPDLHVVRDDDEPAGRLLGSGGSIEVEDAQQTVFVGPAPRFYRVHCETEGFTLLAEGEPVGELLAGQSTDVEASRIAVRGTGTGFYAPLVMPGSSTAGR